MLYRSLFDYAGSQKQNENLQELVKSFSEKYDSRQMEMEALIENVKSRLECKKAAEEEKPQEKYEENSAAKFESILDRIKDLELSIII